MSNYDLFSRGFKADPFVTYADMRRDDPVYEHIAPNGLRIWYITRYQDVADVLRHDDLFCKDLRSTMLMAGEPSSHSATRSVLRLVNRNMLFSDPPDHTRLRTLVGQAFTRQRVEDMESRIQDVADLLIEEVQGENRMELISSFALPLPFAVICDLLGIPASDRDRVQVWAQAIISPGSRGIAAAERKRKIHGFVEYVRALFADRQRTPRDDLLTALAQAEEKGDNLSDTELSSMVMLLLVTGFETTVNLIGNAVYTLLTHPDQLALLKAQPKLMDSALEECLRFDGPVETSTSRWVRNDCSYLGRHMKRGDLVRVVLTSANRDEDQHPNADRFDICRQENRHVAFGLGIHYCLGAPLARAEGRIALGALLRRCPALRLDCAPSALTWRSGVLFRGLKQLPVAWDRTP